MQYCQVPLHHATNAPAHCEMTMSNGSGRCRNYNIVALTFPFGFKVTRNIFKYPLHHVTMHLQRFKVAMSNGLVGSAFTRKYMYII